MLTCGDDSTLSYPLEMLQSVSAFCCVCCALQGSYLVLRGFQCRAKKIASMKLLVTSD